MALNRKRAANTEEALVGNGQLHLSNLRTWRHDEYARQSFDADEVASLEAALAEVANSSKNEGVIINVARQIRATRQ